MRILLAIVLLLAPTAADADSWVSPSTVTLQSPSGKLQAVIVPAADGRSAAKATVGLKGAAGTTYTMQAKWMHVDMMLLDDGSLLALDHWHSMGSGKVATLYERTGKVRWAKTLVELIGQQLIDAAPHSVSSIWWRAAPLEWSLAKNNRTITITLFDENRVRLDLRDGTPTLVTIANLPDEPKRLVNRARALESQPGTEAEMIALLERALAKDPEHDEAIGLLVQKLQRMTEHARAVAVLERVSPHWKAKHGHNLANHYVAWAASLRVLSRVSEAEQRLRLAVAAAPTYTNPAIALATLLIDAKRRREGDAVLTEFVDRLLKQSYLDTYALSRIADFYKQRTEHRRALALYLKGYKKDDVTNQFLYANLARLYEDMGKIADAIRVNEQLLAYFQKMGKAFDSYAKQVTAEIARLRGRKP